MADNKYQPFVVPTRTPFYLPQNGADPPRISKPWLDYLQGVGRRSGRAASWRADWDADGQYFVGEIVRHSGSLWIATQATPAATGRDTAEPGTEGDNVWEYVLTAIPDGGTAGQVLTKASDANHDVAWEDAAAASANIKAGVVGITIDGGGSAPATGSKGFLQVPYAGTITGWTMIGDTSGSAQITVKKSTYAAFPATSSIVASAPPALSSAQKATSTTLTGWTTAITAGDVLEFNLDSVSTSTRLILELKLTKT